MRLQHNQIGRHEVEGDVGLRSHTAEPLAELIQPVFNPAVDNTVAPKVLGGRPASIAGSRTG